MENSASPIQGKWEIPFFFLFVWSSFECGGQISHKKDIYRTIKQISHNKTTNIKIVKQNHFALVFFSMKRIKIAQTGVKTLFFFWFVCFLSPFEFGSRKIATEGDGFGFSSDFGKKFTPSYYSITNASGQAASSVPPPTYAIFNSLNTEYR